MHMSYKALSWQRSEDKFPRIFTDFRKKKTPYPKSLTLPTWVETLFRSLVDSPLSLMSSTFTFLTTVIPSAKTCAPPDLSWDKKWEHRINSILNLKSHQWNSYLDHFDVFLFTSTSASFAHVQVLLTRKLNFKLKCPQTCHFQQENCDDCLLLAANRSEFSYFLCFATTPDECSWLENNEINHT